MPNTENVADIKVAKLEVMVEDIRNSQKDFEKMLLEVGARWDMKYDTLTKMINDRDERYNERFVSREHLHVVKEDIRWLKKVLYTGAGVILMAVLGTVLKSIGLI